MKNVDMLVNYKNVDPDKRWDACLHDLDLIYTTSIRDACKTLKTHRNWVQKYVRPHVHYIYLSNGAGKSANYVRAAASCLHKEIRDSVWLHTQEFEDLIRKGISSCTRQTINIPMEWLIEADKLLEFQKKYRELYQKMQKEPLISFLIAEEMKQLVIKNAHPVGKTVYKNAPSIYKRSAVSPVKCKVPIFSLTELQAVHDIKDYGDADEDIYRMLFQGGCYRLVLTLPDETGSTSEKIFYISPKDKLQHREDSVGNVLIRYEDYQKFFISN